MNIFNLFPTAVGIFDLNRELTKTEIDFIKNQTKRENQGNKTSEDKEILNNSKLKNIRKFIESSVDEYYKNVYVPKNENSLRITQSWCNYTEPGEYHHKHEHPNSFISGVFYLQANIETDRIYFYKNGYQNLKTTPKDFNAYNSDSWWLEAFTGRMYIFPSSLTHMVETVHGIDTRISLSFNTFPVGNFGDDESLSGLKL
jgi:uncharacterized protein (TIGR02466 family)